MTVLVETLEDPHIEDEDIEQLAVLCSAAYPDPNRDEIAFIENMRRSCRSYSGLPEDAIRRYILRYDGRIVANANILPRWIATSKGRLRIAGLSGVVTHPEFRGRGFGKAVVQKAFEAVDASLFQFALFQTGEARHFYEKLGCCIVTNPIINSLNTDAPGANPLWDEWTMRYPAGGDWPEGEIDLLGPAY